MTWHGQDADDWPHCGLTIRTADGEGTYCVIAANHDGDHEDGEGRSFTDEEAERSKRPAGWRDEP